MGDGRVSTGRNGDGQRADFARFPARCNELADVGPNLFPEADSSTHREIMKNTCGCNFAGCVVCERARPFGFDAYQSEALRTAPEPHDERQLAIFALGLAGETGEVIELVKKHIGHGHALDREKMCKELGDVCWYLATLAKACGIPLSEVAEKNVAKLRARYPDGFDPKLSQNRKPGDV